MDLTKYIGKEYFRKDFVLHIKIKEFNSYGNFYYANCSYTENPLDLTTIYLVPVSSFLEDYIEKTPASVVLFQANSTK